MLRHYAVVVGLRTVYKSRSAGKAIKCWKSLREAGVDARLHERSLELEW